MLPLAAVKLEAIRLPHPDVWCLFGGKPTKPISTDSIPMLRRMNFPSIVSPAWTLTISPFPVNVAIGLFAPPNVPMYL